VRLQIRERLDAVAVVEPIPSRRRRDWVLAALLALTALPVAFEDSLPVWAWVVPTALAVGFVPFRHRMPLIAVTSVSMMTIACVALALGGREVVNAWVPAGFAELVLFYTLSRWATPLRVAIGIIVSITSALVVEWFVGDPHLDDLTELVLPWLVVAAFALAMRYRARAIEGRNDQVRLAERNSLARELHDSVAHHVSAIAVQAQAGQFVIDSDPVAAAKALQAIEAIANESIDEMRRMVGILRSDEDYTRSVAPETLDVLANREGRPAVHVSGDTQLDELPAAVGAALFRIAQESITNARQHSRDVTFVDVAVERRGDHVEMTVDNDGTPTTRNAGSGFGQVGMQERVEALGGSFESSARPALGWRTTTVIPLVRVGR